MIETQLADFLRYLKFEKRYAPLTLTAYQNDLEQFSRFLSTDFTIADTQDVSHFHIRTWLAGLKDTGHTEKTINRKMSSLNSFFKYLLKQQLLNKSPVWQLHAMRVPERLPAYLKESETDKLLEEISFGEGFKPTTDRLICELLYQTGMRRNELLQLKESDIEWSLQQIRVLGKGNKERLLPVGPMLLESLTAYIAEKKTIEEVSTDRLLVLENGKPLYAGYIYRVVRDYLSGKGNEKNAITTLSKKSPHIMRHTFATQLLNNGANIQAIKDLLGHSSLAATQIYTHNNIEKLKEIHKMNHPRG